MKQVLFSLVLRAFAKRVEKQYGIDLALKVRANAQREYKAILPHVPDVGGLRNYFAGIVLANAWFIATYKAMKAEGYTVDDSMRIWAEMSNDLFRRIPRWLRVRVGAFLTSDRMISNFHGQAQRSQLREFPANWIYQVNQVAGLDLALEFEQCAAIEMYRQLGVEEMSPYCSFADVTYSAYLGIGIDATQTLGLGVKTCQLYYQRDGEVRYNARIGHILPPELVANPRVHAVERSP